MGTRNKSNKQRLAVTMKKISRCSCAQKSRYSTCICGKSRIYDFVAIDGGTMNNEPFNLAHAELAGLSGLNPRAGDKANRAVIMVDPFAEPSVNEFDQNISLVGVGKALASAFKAQTRFNQIDLTLAEAGDVYSRFMIAPSRNNFKGSMAIASGGMDGFLGFFCEAYRRHDYMLGRQNCQTFLRDWFVLPSSNPLFNDWSQAATNNSAFTSCSTHRQSHRQIIPLVGSAAKIQKFPKWPKEKFCGYKSVKVKMETRLDAAYPLIRTKANDMVCRESKFGSWICRLVVKIVTWGVWRFWLRGKILRFFESKIDTGLEKFDRSELS